MSSIKYHIVTFGCQMNKSDSERIATVLELAGLSPATKIESADLIIINSCSVRQSAINRIFGLLNNLKKKQKLRSCHPKRNPKKHNEEPYSLGREQKFLFPTTAQNFHNDSFKQIKTILTGCVLDADKKKLADKFDLIIDIKELTQKPKKLIDFLNLQNQEFKAFDYTDYFRINPQYRNKFSAYIPIMTGCNNFCSYCAVPYTRGREVSRPAEEIINEIKILIGKGYKEITLLGQNVNSYKSEVKNPPYSPFFKGGEKKEEENSPFAKACPEFISGGVRGISAKIEIETINFPKLLKLINNIPGDFWIRFLTSHPKDMSDKLIKTMVKCEKVTEYVHLPIQSGDDEILNKMNRHYTQEHYLGLIEKIREAYLHCHCEESADDEVMPPADPPKADNPVFLRNKHGIAARSACWRIARNDKSDIWHPSLAISTDIIVGFPGETKKQFANTAKIMRRVKFDMAYLSEYSPRTGTAAAKMEDTVSIAEKKRRKEYLNEVLRKTALANNKKYVGKTVEVLIEKTDTDFFYGKTRTFKNVKISIPADVNDSTSSVIARRPTGRRSNPEFPAINTRLPRPAKAGLAMTNIKPGQFAKIKITQAGAWGMEGKVV